MLNSFNVGKPNPLFILFFPLLTKWAREIEFAPWRERRSVKGHREFPKWRFWEIFGKCKPFLGNPQKPSVYGLFHDFKGKKWKRKKSDFPKNGSLNFILGDFFPKTGVILGFFPKTRLESPKTSQKQKSVFIFGRFLGKAISFLGFWVMHDWKGEIANV